MLAIQHEEIIFGSFEKVWESVETPGGVGIIGGGDSATAAAKWNMEARHKGFADVQSLEPVCKNRICFPDCKAALVIVWPRLYAQDPAPKLGYQSCTKRRRRPQTPQANCSRIEQDMLEWSVSK